MATSQQDIKLARVFTFQIFNLLGWFMIEIRRITYICILTVLGQIEMMIMFEVDQIFASLKDHSNSIMVAKIIDRSLCLYPCSEDFQNDEKRVPDFRN